MAIIKKVKDTEHPKEQKHLVLPAFSFATDGSSPTAKALAQMIVDA
jgi:hypothetical protein